MQEFGGVLSGATFALGWSVIKFPLCSCAPGCDHPCEESI